jgi:hypothetical protein
VAAAPSTLVNQSRAGWSIRGAHKQLVRTERGVEAQQACLLAEGDGRRAHVENPLII